jgi:hypothetical protein
MELFYVGCKQFFFFVFLRSWPTTCLFAPVYSVMLPIRREWEHCPGGSSRWSSVDFGGIFWGPVFCSAVTPLTSTQRVHFRVCVAQLLPSIAMLSPSKRRTYLQIGQSLLMTSYTGLFIMHSDVTTRRPWGLFQETGKLFLCSIF